MTNHQVPPIQGQISAEDPVRSSEEAGNDPAYQVGYGHPPLQHRFQKGQSGNPAGPRPKARLSRVNDALNKALETKVTAETSRGIESLDALEAIMRKLVNTAITEDGTKAAGFILSLLQAADANVEASIEAEIDQEKAERIKANFLARNLPTGPSSNQADVGYRREGGA